MVLFILFYFFIFLVLFICVVHAINMLELKRNDTIKYAMGLSLFIFEIESFFVHY